MSRGWQNGCAGWYHVLEEQSIESANADQTHLLSPLWSRRCTRLQTRTATHSKPRLPRQCPLLSGQTFSTVDPLSGEFLIGRISLKSVVVSRLWIRTRCGQSMESWSICWWILRTTRFRSCWNSVVFGRWRLFTVHSRSTICWWY